MRISIVLTWAISELELKLSPSEQTELFSVSCYSWPSGMLRIKNTLTVPTKLHSPTASQPQPLTPYSEFNINNFERHHAEFRSFNEDQWKTWLHSTSAFPPIMGRCTSEATKSMESRIHNCDLGSPDCWISCQQTMLSRLFPDLVRAMGRFHLLYESRDALEISAICSLSIPEEGSKQEEIRAPSRKSKHPVRMGEWHQMQLDNR